MCQVPFSALSTHRLVYCSQEACRVAFIMPILQLGKLKLKVTGLGSDRPEVELDADPAGALNHRPTGPLGATRLPTRRGPGVGHWDTAQSRFCDTGVPRCCGRVPLLCLGGRPSAGAQGKSNGRSAIGEARDVESPKLGFFLSGVTKTT